MSRVHRPPTVDAGEGDIDAHGGASRDASLLRAVSGICAGLNSQKVVTDMADWDVIVYDPALPRPVNADGAPAFTRLPIVAVAHGAVRPDIGRPLAVREIMTSIMCASCRA